MREPPVHQHGRVLPESVAAVTKTHLANHHLDYLRPAVGEGSQRGTLPRRPFPSLEPAECSLSSTSAANTHQPTEERGTRTMDQMPSVHSISSLTMLRMELSHPISRRQHRRLIVLPVAFIPPLLPRWMTRNGVLVPHYTRPLGTLSVARRHSLPHPNCTAASVGCARHARTERDAS